MRNVRLRDNLIPEPGFSFDASSSREPICTLLESATFTLRPARMPDLRPGRPHRAAH
jgi:hypothetical protein